MAPRVTYSNWPLSGLMNDIAGTTFRPPASLPLPPVSGWASGEPAAALPPPLNLNDRSIAVTSAWKVFLSRVDITAGVFAQPRPEERRVGKEGALTCRIMG